MKYQRTSLDDAETSDGESQISKVEMASRSVSPVAFSRQAPRVGTLNTQSLMFGTLILALLICGAHHVLLYCLNGSDVESFPISQTWIRDIGNTLAKLVQLLLRISAGIVLTQSVWLYVRTNYVTLDDLDALFTLPSISLSGLPRTLLNRRVITALLLAGLIEMLSLVSIFAPNALSVVLASPHNNTRLLVPIPDLERVLATTSSYFVRTYQSYVNGSCAGPTGCEHLLYYINPSPAFQRLARNVLDSGTILPWSPPLGCGRACSYDIHYWGPALNCTQIAQSSINVTGATFTKEENGTDVYVRAGGANIYNAVTSFGQGVIWNNNGTFVAGAQSISLFQSYPFGNPFSLEVTYAKNNFSLPLMGTDRADWDETRFICGFHNASYTATVNYSNGTQTTNARIVEYGAQLGPIKDPLGLNTSVVRGSDPEFLSTYAAMSLANAMSQYIYGSINFALNTTWDLDLFPTLVPAYTSVLGSILTSRTTFDSDTDPQNIGEANTLSLVLASPFYDNLGDLLTDACTNLTASLMSDAANLGLYTNVTTATVIPDHNVYSYQWYRLWIAYGTALTVTFLADVYGLLCIFKNGGSMQREFSSLAASVRSRDLDMLLGEPGAPLLAHAENVRLRYRTGGTKRGERAGFRIADGAKVGDKIGDDVGMDEAVALASEKYL